MLCTEEAPICVNGTWPTEYGQIETSQPIVFIMKIYMFCHIPLFIASWAQYVADMKNPDRPNLGTMNKAVHEKVAQAGVVAATHVVLYNVSAEGIPKCLAWVCYDILVLLVLRLFLTFCGILLDVQASSMNSGLPKSFTYFGWSLEGLALCGTAASAVLCFVKNRMTYRYLVSAATLTAFFCLACKLIFEVYKLLQMKRQMAKQGMGTTTSEAKKKQSRKNMRKFLVQVGSMIAICVVVVYLYLKGMFRYLDSKTELFIRPGIDTAKAQTTMMLADGTVVLGFTFFVWAYWTDLRPKKKQKKSSKTSSKSEARKKRKAQPNSPSTKVSSKVAPAPGSSPVASTPTTPVIVAISQPRADGQ